MYFLVLPTFWEQSKNKIDWLEAVSLAVHHYGSWNNFQKPGCFSTKEHVWRGAAYSFHNAKCKTQSFVVTVFNIPVPGVENNEIIIYMWFSAVGQNQQDSLLAYAILRIQTHI